MPPVAVVGVPSHLGIGRSGGSSPMNPRKRADRARRSGPSAANHALGDRADPIRIPADRDPTGGRCPVPRTIETLPSPAEACSRILALAEPGEPIEVSLVDALGPGPGRARRRRRRPASLRPGLGRRLRRPGRRGDGRRLAPGGRAPLVEPAARRGRSRPARRSGSPGRPHARRAPTPSSGSTTSGPTPRPGRPA